jgi:hypothetical protein
VDDRERELLRGLEMRVARAEEAATMPDTGVAAATLREPGGDAEVDFRAFFTWSAVNRRDERRASRQRSKLEVLPRFDLDLLAPRADDDEDSGGEG